MPVLSSLASMSLAWQGLSFEKTGLPSLRVHRLELHAVMPSLPVLQRLVLPLLTAAQKMGALLHSVVFVALPRAMAPRRLASSPRHLDTLPAKRPALLPHRPQSLLRHLPARAPGSHAQRRRSPAVSQSTACPERIHHFCPAARRGQCRPTRLAKRKPDPQRGPRRGHSWSARSANAAAGALRCVVSPWPQSNWRGRSLAAVDLCCRSPHCWLASW